MIPLKPIVLWSGKYAVKFIDETFEEYPECKSSAIPNNPFDALRDYATFEHYIGAHGINPNEVVKKNRLKSSVLHTAVSLGKYKIVELLIKKGANPNLQLLDTGDTPIHFAVEFKKFGIIELLLNYRANPHMINNLGNNIIHTAVISNIDDIEHFGRLASIANIDIKNKKHKTPLQLAIEQNPRMIPLLIKFGANMTKELEELSKKKNVYHIVQKAIQTSKDISRLFKYVSKNDLENVKKLLQEHPHLVGERNDKNYSVLEIAYMNNHKDIIKYIENNCTILLEF